MSATAYDLAEKYGSKELVLTALQEKEIDMAACMAILKVLSDAENVQTSGVVRPKTGRKGAASVYGLQRMPVTLYPEQWVRFVELGLVQTLEHIAADPPTDIDAGDDKEKEPAIKGRKLTFKGDSKSVKAKAAKLAKALKAALS